MQMCRRSKQFDISQTWIFENTTHTRMCSHGNYTKTWRMDNCGGITYNLFVATENCPSECIAWFVLCSIELYHSTTFKMKQRLKIELEMAQFILDHSCKDLNYKYNYKYVPFIIFHDFLIFSPKLRIDFKITMKSINWIGFISFPCPVFFHSMASVMQHMTVLTTDLHSYNQLHAIHDSSVQKNCLFIFRWILNSSHKLKVMHEVRGILLFLSYESRFGIRFHGD